MKLIFFTLVLANLALAVWGVFFREQVITSNIPNAEPVHEAKVKTITADEGVKTVAAPPSSVSDVAVDGSERRLCELVGTFSDDEGAEVFVERLRSIDIQSTVERFELPSGASYWVHLPPEETTAAAYRKLAELQAMDVESYVIGRGDLQNALSLGVFSREQLATNKKDAMLALGLNPIITVKPRTEIEIWVSIQPEYAEKISELTWENLMEGMSSQERRQNFCLPVAS